MHISGEASPRSKSGIRQQNLPTRATFFNFNNRRNPMNTDVLATKVIEGIAVITLGSAKRMYFDSEMGDALTESLQEFAADPKIRVVIVTGGTPEFFTRLYSIPPL